MANSIASVTMVLNGQTVTLESADGVTWVGQFQAPDGSSRDLTNGAYAAVFTAVYETGGTSVFDGSGSTDLEQQARLVVKETYKPTISVTAPTANAYYTEARQTLDFTVLDNANGQTSGISGVDLSTLAVVLTSTSLGERIVLGSADFAAAAVSGGYRLTKTVELDDATDWRISIDVADYDGNTADNKTVAFKIDTVAPSNSVTLPTADFKTNNNVIAVEGETDGVQVILTVDGTEYGTLTPSGGAYSGSITLTAEGEHTIGITTVDEAGNRTTIYRTVTYSTAVPEFVSVTWSKSPMFSGEIGTVTVVMRPYATES